MNNALENDELAAKPIIRIDECTFRAKLLLFHFTIQGWKPSGNCCSIVELLSVFPLVQIFFIGKFIIIYCNTLPASTVGFYINNSSKFSHFQGRKGKFLVAPSNNFNVLRAILYFWIYFLLSPLATLVRVNCTSSTALCRPGVHSVHFLSFLLSQLISCIVFESTNDALRGWWKIEAVGFIVLISKHGTFFLHST